jgi:tetratricopeptide (TPR) repeat protein
MSRRRTKRSLTSTRICSALVAALLLLVAGSALAQSAEERARVLFREANQLFARKLYLDALAKYREAKALYPSHKIDLNIGGTLDALGRRTEAAIYFERFLLQSATAPREIIAAANARLAELRGKLARVKVTTLADGATIFADGVSVGTTPLDLPVYLEPGEHTLEARRAGASPTRRTLTVSVGQEQSLDLSPAPASVPATRAVASAPASVPAPRAAPASLPVTPPEDDAVARRRRTRTIMAWTSLAVGGACALTAAFLYGAGVWQGDAAYERYRALTAADPAARFESEWGEVESAKSKVVAGHVMTGLAVVGLGLATWSFLTRPERAASVQLLPSGTGVSLRGSF